MGIYLQIFKIDFNLLRDKINIKNEEYLWNFIKENSSEILQEFKSHQLINTFVALEYASKYLKEKQLYYTFFDSINWTTCDDDTFIDITKYSIHYRDDLGFLKKHNELYWKSLDYNTLKLIVEDFKSIDFKKIEESLELFLLKQNKNIKIINKNILKVLEVYTTQIIDIYRQCINDKTGIIITFD